MTDDLDRRVRDIYRDLVDLLRQAEEGDRPDIALAALDALGVLRVQAAPLAAPPVGPERENLR